MRRPRLKAPAGSSVAYYHCVSRVVNRELIFGPEEKEKLVEFMRVYERLYGLRVVSYCMMSNHFRGEATCPSKRRNLISSAESRFLPPCVVPV